MLRRPQVVVVVGEGVVVAMERPLWVRITEPFHSHAKRLDSTAEEPETDEGTPNPAAKAGKFIGVNFWCMLQK